MKEITHKELLYEAQSLPRFVVHQIQYGTTATVAEISLQKGAHLVKQIRDEEAWHSVEREIEYNLPKVMMTSSHIVAYSVPPPQVTPHETTTVKNTTKEWFEPPTAEEVFALDDLEDFESTDLSSLSRTRLEDGALKQGTKRPLSLNTEKYEAPNQDGPNRKILRLDNVSLHHVIPQPHIQLSKTSIPLDFDVIETYDRAQPTFIPPYTAPLLSANDDTSRRAWIIPVRGFLPSAWNEAGASSAIVLDPEHPDSSLDMTTTGSMIKWSHFALKEFWKYLNTLRDLNNLGSLGISFHPAQNAALRLRMEKENLASLPSLEMHQGPHPAQVSLSRSSLSTGSQSDQLITETRSSSLRDCDYFKVYHDARISMHLRRALDVFTFRLEFDENEQSVLLVNSGQCEPLRESEANPSSSESAGYSKATNDLDRRRKTKTKKPKYCLLRGARLVLVDERSRGVLIA